MRTTRLKQTSLAVGLAALGAAAGLTAARVSDGHEDAHRHPEQTTANQGPTRTSFPQAIGSVTWGSAPSIDCTVSGSARSGSTPWR